MAVSLDSSVLDQLNTTEARKLHELTDKLTTCGVGKIVNLPQIIVVGEQSAGKSSVLEAVSHVRFPVKGDVCTRFATEIVLRQAKQTRVDVSVRFDDKSKPSQTIRRVGFSEDDLPGIIKEAKESMGIASTGRDFSKDILRLEIEGPNMYPLTLVDLPGLYHVETANQSMQGKKTVDQLVESYMRQKNSIILVVVTASNHLANHIALKKVKEHDPNRERTLGVITKPDLTRQGTFEERNYIQLARNQESAHKLKLGWHVLRNRAEDEDALDTRDATEASFFETTAWAAIPRDDRGIGSLRKKLSKVLYNHIRQNLPAVIDDIEGKLRERQEELDQLGPSRSSSQEMRSFLLNISQKFQKLVWDAIYGRYNDPFFGDLGDTNHKLRAQLRNFNRAFDYVLATKGSRLAIAPGHDWEDTPPTAPEFLQNFLQEYPYDFPEPESISREALRSLLEGRAAANQGCEFPGSSNTDLIIQLFQTYASPWKDIAAFHLKQVTLVAKAFVDHLFRHIVGQSDGNPTTEAILCGCVDPFFAAKEKLLTDKLEELLQPYLRGYGMPLDVEFRQMVMSRTVKRLAERLAEMPENRTNQTDVAEFKRLKRDMLEEATSTLETVDGGQFGTEKIIDMMLAYYEMSRRTFTDTVINLAIESCLIRNLPDILTPTKVDKMGEERIRELAAEAEDAQARRDQLKEETIVLREGLEQCRKYKPRGVTVVPSSKAIFQSSIGGKSMAASMSTSTAPAKSAASHMPLLLPATGSSLDSTSLILSTSSTMPASPLIKLPAGPSVAQGKSTPLVSALISYQQAANISRSGSSGIEMERFAVYSSLAHLQTVLTLTLGTASSNGGLTGGDQSSTVSNCSSSVGLFDSKPQPTAAPITSGTGGLSSGASSTTSKSSGSGNIVRLGSKSQSTTASAKPSNGGLYGGTPSSTTPYGFSFGSSSPFGSEPQSTATPIASSTGGLYGGTPSSTTPYGFSFGSSSPFGSEPQSTATPIASSTGSLFGGASSTTSKVSGPGSMFGSKS
ncbi:dynamin family protein [Pochonia chlamydosporia 170]|uniref:Dynamin family protein n=1 Tax=Pochonia chlamydosporia 170 TaxID=1380566 RepID=A0A179FPF0_METCM|nr:dynamin family protein [Pochonia chlamydosporia 170]OAQ67158.1 dynamin family protein [Pochonia chlamydosporia 170]